MLTKFLKYLFDIENYFYSVKIIEATKIIFGSSLWFLYIIKV